MEELKANLQARRDLPFALAPVTGPGPAERTADATASQRPSEKKKMKGLELWKVTQVRDKATLITTVISML